LAKTEKKANKKVESLDQEFLLKVLGELCNTASPTGYTENAMQLVAAEFKKMGIRTERAKKGSLMAFVDGKGMGYKRVIAAHTDTLGGMVKAIKSNGKLSITALGGYMATSVECENVIIHSNEKKFTGTLYTTKPSVHIHGPEARSLERTLENLEVAIDEKVKNEEEVRALGIEVGDFVSFESRFRVTESGFVKSRHLDDKGGVSVILTAIKQIAAEMKANGGPILEEGVEILITGHEEMGYGASSNIPDEAVEMLCVDMGTPGPDQETDEYTVSICAKDSAMPYDINMKNKLIKLSKENNIGYKVDTYNFYGSDGKASLVAGFDLRVGLIGPGIFASHSYERTHVDSLMCSARLVYEYLKTTV